MQKLQGIFKLRVKIYGQEFEAEGPADLVRAQFEAFRQLMQGMSLYSGAAGPDENPNTIAATKDTASKMDALARSDDFKSLFRMRPHEQLLSLHQPPTGRTPEADAALLLLFGYTRYRHEEEVPVTTLNAALTQSGCHVRRLDRILKEYLRDRSIVRSGRGKGGRYRLTNLGVHKAERLLAKRS